MKQIAMKCGAVALVDDADFDFIARHAWHLSHNGYAIRRQRMPDGTKPMIYMHLEIFGETGDMDVDHHDQNKLNNCRINLRLATRSLNNANAKIRVHTSRFKGVCWDRVNSRWMAYISHECRRKYLGRFDDEEAAAVAYNAAAIENFGAFARINHLTEAYHSTTQ